VVLKRNGFNSRVKYKTNNECLFWFSNISEVFLKGILKIRAIRKISD